MCMSISMPGFWNSEQRGEARRVFISRMESQESGPGPPCRAPWNRAGQWARVDGINRRGRYK